MTNVNQPLKKPGQIIPAFTLPGADGMPHSPWDYKQRQPAYPGRATPALPFVSRSQRRSYIPLYPVGRYNWQSQTQHSTC
jgi:hypothetical protein